MTYYEENILLLAVNILTNSNMISYMTKTDIS